MESDNGFNLENLRLTQDFSTLVGGKKLVTTVPVRRRSRQEFLRVHPDESWRFQTAVLELKEEREIFLVDQALWPTLGGAVLSGVGF